MMNSVLVVSLMALVVFSAAHSYSRPRPAKDSGASCPRTTPEQNQRLTIDYKNAIFRDHKYDQIDRYIAENYIGHTPEEPNGREALSQVIPTWFEGTTGTLQIVRTAAEGDLVWLHIHYMYGEDITVVDIMRIECGKIAEHWDVVLPMDATNSTNPHPYF